MAWIQTVSDEEANGLLRTLYEAARGRAGRVFNIVRAQSLNPPVLLTAGIERPGTGNAARNLFSYKAHRVPNAG